MNNYDNPVQAEWHPNEWVTPPFEWELKESDIDSEMCKKCTATDLHCCQQAIFLAGPLNPRLYELISTMIENIPELHIRDNGEIILTCSHLKKGQCDIYETRPQICKDFNCVAHTKVQGHLEIYKKVLKIKKENS